MPDPDYSVLHVPESNRFEARREQARLGLLLYRRSGEVLVLTHTEVEPELQGQGIGGDLVRAGLEYARGEHLKVVPRCPFALAYVRRHSRKYGDLIEPDSRSLLER
jgi:predicted GNAT family acetyltransferase